MTTPPAFVRKPLTIVIAGAGGFVGRALMRCLAGEMHVIGLSRGAQPPLPQVEWRSCDLFSMLQSDAALEGVDCAIYLVHSMLPARLTQARFEDMDLILADNFARSAARNGVRQIIYLGGLIPEGRELSKHLASRQEVECVLAARGVPVTYLRAGMIIGAGGSSFQIMLRLVQRLPFMICPRWTRTFTQPIALEDVIASIRYCVGRKEAWNRTYDLGGSERMSYREMMQRTALLSRGRKNIIFTVPFFSAGLSVAWVNLVTGAHRELVKPLVQSLRHPMVARAERRLPLGKELIPFDDAVREALHESRLAGAQKTKISRTNRGSWHNGGYVVSIQRLPRPPGRSAHWVALEYARWLPRLFWLIVWVEVDPESNIRFYFAGLKRPLLELAYSGNRSSSERSLYYITGGILCQVGDGARAPARLEFRETPDGRSVMASIFNFRPRLPWLIYRYTQAPIHLLIMRLFARHLRSFCGRS